MNINPQTTVLMLPAPKLSTNEKIFKFFDSVREFRKRYDDPITRRSVTFTHFSVTFVEEQVVVYTVPDDPEEKPERVLHLVRDGKNRISTWYADLHSRNQEYAHLQLLKLVR